MKIVSTFHDSSSVLSSVKCRLSTRDLEHLVVAKLNRIDAYSLRAHGLQHECGLDVWGKICSVKALKVSAYDGRSNIALMITHPDPELLIISYNEEEAGHAKLVVEKQLALFERSPRLAEFYTDFLIHPSGKLAVVSSYAGKLKIISLKGGQYAQDFDVSIPEVNVLSLSFLPTADEDYTLAILHIDIEQRLILCARDIDIDNLELSPQYSVLLQATIISEKVVPYPDDSLPQLISVPPDAAAEDEDAPDDVFLGGILVVGGRQILLFDLASTQSQEKQRGKQKRLEAKKKSLDAAESAQARAKERERESRKRKAKASVEWPWSNVSAWCPIEQGSSLFLIGDTFGRLAMLSLANLNPLGIILLPLGETSQPTTLTYLTNQIVYLGSHLGDSQLLRISQTPVSAQKLAHIDIPPEIKTVSSGSLSATPSRKGKGRALPEEEMDVDDETAASDYTKGRVVEHSGSFVSVLDTYKNIAPIMDAILVDTDGSGQNQIVTCSGGANTGSVNIVRNGADFIELAFVSGLLDVTRVWSVKTNSDDSNDSHILVSGINESHLFRIGKGSDFSTLTRIDSSHLGGLILDEPTLAFTNFKERKNNEYVHSELVAQVVSTAAYLFEWNKGLETYVERAKWKLPPKTLPTMASEVVVACANSSQVALALNGGTIVLLCIADNKIDFEHKRRHELKPKREVSAMSLTPLKSKSFSNLLTVAYWETNTIEILDLGHFHSRATSPPLPSVIRSLLLYNFGMDNSSKGGDYHAYLLAGLGDGSVATMLWQDGALKDLQVISLGHAPVNVTPCMVDGRKAVLAAGNRASVFFVEKGRLMNSPIMLREISASSSFNTDSFPSSVILAAPTGLFIGCVRDLNKMHIRTAPFGLDNPRRIVHEPSLKAYGVACTRTEPTRIGEYESSRSSFQILDDNNLSILGQYKCEPDEEITSLTSFTITVAGQQKQFFCLGTVIFKPEEKEPSAGRLLLFTAYANPSRRAAVELSMLTSTQVNGCVFALRMVNEKIVAAVNSSILMYHVEVEAGITPEYSLHQDAEWNHNYMVTSLGSFDSRIVAGDQISSVSLLKVTDNKLISEARDYGPLYPVAVEALGETTLICANDALNIALFSLGKSVRGEALERVGSYHLADNVCKFLRGAISTDKSTGSSFKPEIMFFTSSGRICVIIDVRDNDLSVSLTELQRNLAAVVQGAGGVSHARFRAPKNTRGSSDADPAAFGFLDGDFLDRFPALLESPEKLKRVMEGGSAFEKLKMSKEEIMKVLELLQSLH